MKKQDRYGNALTTRSDQAFDRYCDGVDLFLAAQPGGIEAIAQATELDPEFAVAHADLARALQITAQPAAAKASMARAQALLPGLTGADQAQQKGHILIMQDLLSGKGTEAFDKIKQHVQTWPRDVMAVQPCCGVFGLIGFSGRVGREQENADFMAALQPHYDGDWWFDSQYAFALCEIGEISAAEVLNERAFAVNPANANAVHHRAHIHYEVGDQAAGHQVLTAWRATYDRDAILHCHLAWHDALWSLADDNYEALWSTVRADLLPAVATAPPINILTDLIAVLFRAELAGVTVDAELWQIATDYALASFPRPGMSFVDAHSAICYSRTAKSEPLETLRHSPRGAAGDLVEQIANAFVAFQQREWSSFTQQLAPVMGVHERLGGSRAQRDLLELSYDFGLQKQGKPATSTRLGRAVG